MAFYYNLHFYYCYSLCSCIYNVVLPNLSSKNPSNNKQASLYIILPCDNTVLKTSPPKKEKNRQSSLFMHNHSLPIYHLCPVLYKTMSNGTTVLQLSIYSTALRAMPYLICNMHFIQIPTSCALKFYHFTSLCHIPALIKMLPCPCISVTNRG